jgi:hypothetical protein
MTRSGSRLTTALAPLIGIGLLLGAVGCSRASDTAGPGDGSAAGGPGPAAAGPGAKPDVRIDTTGAWKDYDAKGLAWAKCLQDNGLAVTYRGHRDNAENPLNELSGVDYRDKNNPAYAKCRAQQPTDSDRPTPFMVMTLAPDELQRQLVFAKCMRKHGFADFPDPNPANREPNKYDDIKPGVDPAYDKANVACSKEAGFVEGNGG